MKDGWMECKQGSFKPGCVVSGSTTAVIQGEIILRVDKIFQAVARVESRNNIFVELLNSKLY